MRRVLTTAIACGVLAGSASAATPQHRAEAFAQSWQAVRHDWPTRWLSTACEAHATRGAIQCVAIVRFPNNTIEITQESIAWPHPKMLAYAWSN